VSALVDDIINPIIAVGLNNVENLKEAYIKVEAAKIL